MLSKDDRREVRLWIHDRVAQTRKNVEKTHKTLPKTVHHWSDKDVPTRIAFLACGHFEIEDEEDKAVVLKIAETAAAMTLMPAAMIATPTIRLSREDLLDIAFWTGREDTRTANMFQVEEFFRTVVRLNIEQLHAERVPPKKFVIKRAKK